MPNVPTIEICVEGIDGYLAAEKAGADRVELCASLMEGGLTPSIGTVREVLRAGKIPFHPIIRPRGGDFLYSEMEFASILEDIRQMRALGVVGIVIGFLNADGTIDEDRTQQAVDAAGPMTVTCHRAFDMTRNHREAVEALVRAGVDRVLTSGQHDTALEGVDVLKDTIQAAGDRLIVMVCGELDAANIAEIRDRTGAQEMHFAALTTTPSTMQFRNPRIGMGSTDLEREYLNTITNEEAVRQTIRAAKTL